MSDLSWLNPTPHAIAVYASQPTSPLTTQHSLPSGRYPLLGPDFHRLDRTSFAWRTHSITSSARASRVAGMSRPSAFAAFRLITSSPCRLHDGQVRRLSTFENLTGIDANLMKPLPIVACVADESASFDEFAMEVNCGNPIMRCQRWYAG